MLIREMTYFPLLKKSKIIQYQNETEKVCQCCLDLVKNHQTIKLSAEIYAKDQDHEYFYLTGNQLFKN